MHFQREIAVHCCIITKDRDSPPDMSKYSDWFAADPFPTTPHSYEWRTARRSISLYKTHLRLYAIWNHAIKCYLNQWDKTVSRCWRQLCRLTRGIHVSHVQFIESVALKRKKTQALLSILQSDQNLRGPRRVSYEADDAHRRQLHSFAAAARAGPETDRRTNRRTDMVPFKYACRIGGPRNNVLLITIY